MMFFGGWMWILWIVIIGLIVWGIATLVRRDNSSLTGRDKKPLDIARERYARGEITKDEFDELKKNLS